MSDTPPWLLFLYYSSQSLMAIALSAGVIGAFKQLRSYKQFEILKYIDSDEMRKARHTVIFGIPKTSGDWWDPKSKDFNPDIEENAARVCDSYEILASMMRADRACSSIPGANYANYFKRTHRQSIVRTHTNLLGYIRWRREQGEPERYIAYTDLANKWR